MKLALWDFQAEAFNRARQAVRDGHRRILIVSPTGSGKSVIGAALMDSVMSKGGAANFVVDRLSLINQTSRLLDNYGIQHGIVQADHERNRPTMPVQVCSIHTLLRRAWPGSRVDIFDEAHILMEEHKRRMKEAGVITIGLTATPFTKGLAKFFDTVINVATTRDLINRGFLAPYRIFSYKEPDMTGVKVRSTGEWDETEASKRALEVVGDVVKEYMAHADGRKFICSAVDTKHVQELQRQFLAAGINAATYTYKDKADDRADVLEEFRRPNSLIRGLITVTAASRGFDQPDVSCIIMARPLRKSLAEHIQLLGRGLRTAPGKVDGCVVLDHSGNASRFWNETEEFFEFGMAELDDGKPKRKPPKHEPEKDGMKCPSCGHLHKPAPFCPACGHQYPPRKAVQHVPGTLKELISGQFKRELIKELWPQVCGYAHQSYPNDPDRAGKFATAVYIDLTGSLPDGYWYRSTKNIEPTTEVRNMIKAKRIAYFKRQKGEREAKSNA